MASIVHWNCCGLRGRRLEVDEFLKSMKVTVLVVNETKLDPKWNFNFKNYKKVAINNSPSRAWGTAIFVHFKVSMKVVYMHSGPDFEAILIRCTLSGQPRDILGVYWPGDYAGDIADWRKILRMVRHPLYMVGDFNAHHQGLFNSSHTNNRGRVVEQLLDEFNLVKISHGPTYRRPHQAESELDVALVSNSLIGETTWRPYTESLGSDHTPGILGLTGRPTRGPVYRVDWGKYRATLDNLLDKGEGGGASLPSLDLVETVSNFVSQIQTAVKCARVKTTPHTASHVAYWSVACQKYTNARKSAYRRWCRTRSLEHYLLYKQANAECRRFLRQQRRRSFEMLCERLNERCNLRLAWSLVHGVAGLRGVSCVNSSQLISDLGEAPALQAAWDHFHQLYTSRSQRQAKDCLIIPTGRAECRAFGDPFTMQEFLTALLRRKSTSPGEDGITYNMLKSLPAVGKRRVLEIFNDSWLPGTVPSLWKVGKIILLP